MRISSPKEKRGSFEGAIRIPLHASLFLFIDLAFLAIPRKSFGFLTLLFSIPTAPTNHLPDGWTLNKNTLGKRADKANDPVLYISLSAARVTTGFKMLA